MEIKKFAGHEQAAAKIYYYKDGSMTLISYTTTVAQVDSEGWLSINVLRSRTTIKHIGWFAKLLGTSYATCKQIYLDGKEMNIHTGEIRDWE